MTRPTTSPVDPDRLVAEADRPRVVEDEAAQPLARAGRLRRDERVAAEEVARLVERDREPEARLVRRLVRGDVARPDAVALLEPERVDRPVAGGDHPVRRARPSQSVAQSAAAVLGRRVQLPAELADVGDPQREERHAADRDLARGEEREGRVREVVARERREDVASPRAPQPEADPGRR